LIAASFGCGGNTAITNDSANTAVAQVANSTTVPVVPPPANMAGANTNTAKIVNANPAANTNIKPGPMVFPAPDDSEYSSTMDKSGEAIETRTFHHNPQILKVTRIWKSPTDKTIEIHLKNGKVIKLLGDQFPNINNLPVSEFLKAAGLQGQQTEQRPAKQDKPKSP
jgi:hypothetical protein